MIYVVSFVSALVAVVLFLRPRAVSEHVWRTHFLDFSESRRDTERIRQLREVLDDPEYIPAGLLFLRMRLAFVEQCGGEWRALWYLLRVVSHHSAGRFLFRVESWVHYPLCRLGHHRMDLDGRFCVLCEAGLNEAIDEAGDGTGG